MANEQNLIPFNERTPEEHRELSKKGAEMANKVKRQKKSMKEQLELLLSLPIKNEKIKAQLKELGIEENQMNNQMALLIAQYQKGLKGDTQAFNTLRDTSGQAIANKVEIEQVPTIIDDI